MLGISFWILFVNYSIRLGYGIILPEMLQDLGLGRTAGASIFNTYFLLYVSLSPLAGMLTDRFGARGVIGVALLVLSLGVFLMGAAGGLAGACLSFGIAGLGSCGIWVPVLTLTQRWFFPTRKGLALGILSTGFGLGFALMGLLVPWAVRAFSWRWAWYLLGACALLMGVLALLFLRSAPEPLGLRPWGGPGLEVRPTPTPALHGVKSPLLTILRTGIFWQIGLSYFAISYALYGITTFMVDYARNGLGLPLEQAGFLATIHGTCQAFGVLTLLPLSDRLGRRPMILLSNGVIFLAVLGIAWMGVSWPVLVALVAAMAIFYGVTFPIYGACAGDYFNKEVMGTVAGAWTPFYGLGAILVHWVTGALRDASGVYTSAFWLCAGMAFAGIALMALVKRKPL